MEIQLPSDIASVATTVASNKGYDSVADYIAALVKRESEQELIEAKSSNYQQSPEWIATLRQWSAGHPKTSHFVDTSREGVYGDRGL